MANDTKNLGGMDADEAARWEAFNAAAREEARQQAITAMRYNGNGPECLPHLACGGCGCSDCIGGARRCGCCVKRVAITTIEDGTPEGMDVCGWCAEEIQAQSSQAVAAKEVA